MSFVKNSTSTNPNAKTIIVEKKQSSLFSIFFSQHWGLSAFRQFRSFKNAPPPPSTGSETCFHISRRAASSAIQDRGTESCSKQLEPHLDFSCTAPHDGQGLQCNNVCNVGNGNVHFRHSFYQLKLTFFLKKETKLNFPPPPKKNPTTEFG